jgi:flagellar biosynthesis/type III secretory pathway M-ring protein FliF/YscJ
VQVLLARWSRLSGRTRTLVVALFAVALVAVGLAYLLERDTRVPLFAEPLSGEQVNEVIGRLAEWHAAFGATGDNVRVDARRQSELLLRLSLAGVPHAHVVTSSEVLAKAGPMTPESVLDAQRRNGLAGDLELALRGIAGVQDARVIIAAPRPAEFVDDKPDLATASVRLTLAVGAALPAATADGIRAFVAAAVPGLDAKRVTLLDDRGVALDGGRVFAGDETAALATSLQSALDATFGVGATIVRVRVAHDGRTREIHETRRAPLGARPIVSSTDDERYGAERKHYVKRHADEERGSDVREERWDIPAGSGERLSVAVAVDAARNLDLEKIRALSAATVGIVAERGDVLSVEAVRFARPAAPPRPANSIAFGYIATWIPLMVVAFALVAAVRYGTKPLVQAFEATQARAAIARTTQAVAGFAPSQVLGALSGEPPHTAAAIISALPTATATAVLEMYSPEERAAIVRRLARTAAPVVPDARSLLHRG